uniref:Uncharacterized protein n=1 Tax=Anguilla anguilla TaxID=7936 RepID=A0A0E9PFU7_ANGAN
MTVTNPAEAISDIFVQKILRLCKPTVSSAVRVAGLRQIPQVEEKLFKNWAEFV